MTLYDAKFTAYSTYQTLERLVREFEKCRSVTDQQYRAIKQAKEDLRKVITEEWDLGRI